MNRHPGRRVSALVAGTLLVAGCGGGTQPSDAPRSQPPSAEAAKPSTVSTPSKARPFTIAFGGDVNFQDTLRARLAERTNALGPMSARLRAADLSMVNLETAITTRGTPAPSKEFTFRAPRTALSALRGSGVDVATMANNHAVDYGPVGLRDSLAAIRTSHFPVVGIGANSARAFRAWHRTVKGNRVAVIGATQVLDDNLVQAWTATAHHGGLASAKLVARLVQAVKAARRSSDVVVVYLHWGQELRTCPLPRQQALARTLAAAGADIIVGGHAHVPLGAGRLGHAYVDYGFGNFLFAASSAPTQSSGVLTLSVTGRKVTRAKWSPAMIESGVPQPLTGTAASAAVEHWKGLRACTGLRAVTDRS